MHNKFVNNRNKHNAQSPPYTASVILKKFISNIGPPRSWHLVKVYTQLKAEATNVHIANTIEWDKT